MSRTRSWSGGASAATASHLVPPPLALPRAQALTDALLVPPPQSPVGDVTPLLASRLGRAVGDAVGRGGRAAATGPREGGRTACCVRIGAYQLLSAGRTAQVPHAPTAFRWTASRARRVVGLAALRRVLDGHATAPAEAVAAVIADSGGHGELGMPGPGSCADWLASLPSAGRAAVRAAATTWATQLWCAVEWSRVQPAPLAGPPDRWWTCGSRVRVALRGRADVRLEGAGGVHLSMLGGQPTPESRMALCLSALVDLLSRGADAVPSRVAGWWPDAGKAWIVPVDAAALSAVADAAGRAAAARAGHALAGARAS